jgi:hypothetical protein
LTQRHKVYAQRETLCSMKGEDGRGIRWWTTARLRRTTTSLSRYVHFEEAGGVGSSSSPSTPTSVPESSSTLASATLAAPRSPTAASATSSSLTPPQPATPRTPALTATPPDTSTPAPAHVEHSLVEFATPLSR